MTSCRWTLISSRNSIPSMSFGSPPPFPRCTAPLHATAFTPPYTG